MILLTYFTYLKPSGLLQIDEKIVRQTRKRRRKFTTRPTTTTTTTTTKEARPWIDSGDIDTASSSDILYSLVALWNDADALSDRLGRDRVVTSHHDDLDAGGPAFSYGVRNGGTRRINHWHESDKTQPRQRKIHFISVELVSLKDRASVSQLTADNRWCWLSEVIHR